MHGLKPRRKPAWPLPFKRHSFRAGNFSVNLLAATLPTAVGHVINVGTGVSVTLNQFVGELSHILGPPITPRNAPARPGDVRESRADISQMRSLLSNTPRVSLRAGLEETMHVLRHPQ